MEDFQALSSLQGRAFEDAVATILLTLGFSVLKARFRDTDSGEEIDFVVDTPSGTRVWVECKGSWNTAKKDVPGLRRSDTAKKAVATAWHLRSVHGSTMPPYLLVTSHLPREGSYSDRLIKSAVAEGLFDAAVGFTDLEGWLAQFSETGPGEIPVTGRRED